MGKRIQYEIPAAVKEAQERFEEWRSSQPGRRPIPESLWALPTELSRSSTAPDLAGLSRMWWEPA